MHHKVAIYHRTDRSRFFEFTDSHKFGDKPALQWVYEYWPNLEVPLDMNAVLQQVWRANNRVDGSPIEVLPKDHRSLSVGDVAVIDDNAWQVLGAGWERLPTNQLIDALDQGKSLHDAN